MDRHPIDPPCPAQQRTHPLGVTPGLAVVLRERPDQREHPLGRLLDGLVLRRGEQLPQCPGAARAAGQLGPRRRVVGEDEGELEQHGEREKPADGRGVRRLCEGKWVNDHPAIISKVLQKLLRKGVSQ